MIGRVHILVKFVENRGAMTKAKRMTRVNEHYQQEMQALSMKKSKEYWEKQVKQKVSEEKLLNEMFVLLEYSDSFKEFVRGMTPEALKMLASEIRARQDYEDDL